MNFDDAYNLIHEVKCPPFEFYAACFDCGDGQPCTDDKHVWYLEAWMWRMDTELGRMSWGHGGRQLIDGAMTDDAIVKACLVACFRYAEHEVREAFTWRGRRVFDPHMPVLTLWKVAPDVC